MKWNWGTAVVITYTVFAAATSGFVVFAMHRPVSLVRPDYYAESLREDARMAASTHAQDLGDALSITATPDRAIVVAVPTSHAASARGSVTFYRASNPLEDRTFSFAPNAEGKQTLPATSLASGHWVVKLQWTAAGRDYYTEQRIVLP